MGGGSEGGAGGGGDGGGRSGGGVGGRPGGENSAACASEQACSTNACRSMCFCFPVLELVADTTRVCSSRGVDSEWLCVHGPLCNTLPQCSSLKPCSSAQPSVLSNVIDHELPPDPNSWTVIVSSVSLNALLEEEWVMLMPPTQRPPESA